MKKMKMNKGILVTGRCLLVAGCCVLVSGYSVAQTTEEDLDTISIEIIKEYEPTISDAYKVNDNPQIYDTVSFVTELTYSIKSRKINTVFEVEPIKPARIKGEPLVKLYKNYAKAGFGTNSTSYAEIFLNNLRSRKYAVGAHIKHLSSTGKIKDVAYSGYSDNEVNLYGKKFYRWHTLSGDVNYKRNVVHYYGFNPNAPLIKNLGDTIIGKDAIRQRFSLIDGQLQLISQFKDSAKVNHNLKLKYYNLNDIYGSMENNLSLTAQFNRYVDRELFSLNVLVDYNNFNTDLDSTQTNAIINLNPMVRTSGKKYAFLIGLNAYVEPGDAEPFHFFPVLDFSYNIIDNFFIPYIGITSMIERNSFKSFTDENPFFIPYTELKNTNHQFLVYGGIKGIISSATSFNVRVSYDTKIDRMPFFVNDTSALLGGAGGLNNQFTIDYYDNVKLLDIHAELAHQKTEKFKMIFVFDYTSWTMADEKKQQPWHKPDYEFTLSGVYNLKDKIILNADIFVFGKQLAKTYPLDSLGNYLLDKKGKLVIEPKKLPGMVDINLSLEYRYTKKFSAFIRFNNIGAFRYQRWYNYPTQRFNVLGGITYGF